MEWIHIFVCRNVVCFLTRESLYQSSYKVHKSCSFQFPKSHEKCDYPGKCVNWQKWCFWCQQFRLQSSQWTVNCKCEKGFVLRFSVFSTGLHNKYERNKYSDTFPTSLMKGWISQMHLRLALISQLKYHSILFSLWKTIQVIKRKLFAIYLKFQY